LKTTIGSPITTFGDGIKNFIFWYISMSKLYLFVYNVLIILAIPIIAIVVLFNKKYRKELFYKIHERFTCFKPLNKNSTKKTIWIHCVSLGEVRAVEYLLDRLKDDYFIVLTSLTKSGREYAEKLQKVGFVCLLPLDIYPIMKKAFNIINPDLLVIVETEFWVSMLYVASHRSTRIITVNGRMSEKSFRAYKKARFFWEKFVGLINVVIARSTEDAERFRYLTHGKSIVLVSGNIKYDKDFNRTAKRKNFSLKDTGFIFTAGSVRLKETELIADAYKKVEGNFKIFFAPRHISRINEIEKILTEKHINYSLFSANDFSGDFVLVDIFGKLNDIYSISDICFVGGSLVDKGGQNPIEPAAYGKPVLFGKYMDNFRTEAECLLKSGGAFIVKDSDDLANKINMFISNKQLIKNVGALALETVNKQKGAGSFTIDKIKEILDAK
jgi:3-deoxy-D-manno-octulosonic-acid transferase